MNFKSKQGFVEKFSLWVIHIHWMFIDAKISRSFFFLKKRWCHCRIDQSVTTRGMNDWMTAIVAKQKRGGYWTQRTVTGKKQDSERSKTGGVEQGKAQATRGINVDDRTGKHMHRGLTREQTRGSWEWYSARGPGMTDKMRGIVVAC